MKNSLSVICLLVLLFVLLPSCNHKDDNEAKDDNKTEGNKEENKEITGVINDYLPLKVGTKYRYGYIATYGYIDESSIQKGECTWSFISKSVDEPVVYLVEQSFNGYYVHRNNYTGRRDSSQIENQISTLSFEVLDSTKVAFNFSVPYWGKISEKLERFIRSDKVDTCFTLNKIIDRGCLRKNVGITNLNFYSGGNHSSHVEYTLFENLNY